MGKAGLGLVFSTEHACDFCNAAVFLYPCDFGTGGGVACLLAGLFADDKVVVGVAGDLCKVGDGEDLFV